MTAHRLRRALSKGRPCLGLIENLGSPEAAEHLAAAGPDWVGIDCEHARLTPDRLVHAVRAVQSVSDVSALVRLPDHSVAWCKWALDTGALALAVPMTESAEQAERFVSQCLLPPLGKRSWGGGRAVLCHGSSYLADFNETVILLVQIESQPGLDNLDAILAVPHLTGILIGPEDLSRSLDIPRAELFEQKNRVLRDLVQRTHAARRYAAIWVRDGDEANRAIELGIDMIGAFPTALMLSRAAQSAVIGWPARFAGESARIG